MCHQFHELKDVSGHLLFMRLFEIFNPEALRLGDHLAAAELDRETELANTAATLQLGVVDKVERELVSPDARF